MELIFSALIIFALRLADQSLGTMRSLLVAKNKSIYAALIGLVESAIWIIAVSQVIKDIDDPVLIGAYAAGFAAGTIIGSYIFFYNNQRRHSTNAYITPTYQFAGRENKIHGERRKKIRVARLKRKHNVLVEEIKLNKLEYKLTSQKFYSYQL